MCQTWSLLASTTDKLIYICKKWNLTQAWSLLQFSTFGKQQDPRGVHETCETSSWQGQQVSSLSSIGGIISCLVLLFFTANLQGQDTKSPGGLSTLLVEHACHHQFKERGSHPWARMFVGWRLQRKSQRQQTYVGFLCPHDIVKRLRLTGNNPQNSAVE